MTDPIKLVPRYVQEAQDILSNLTDAQARDVIMFLAEKFVNEVEQGLEGEIEYEDAPFFEVIDKMYDEHAVKGCFFCDRGIDGNETPFDYPETTKLCLSCMLKVANLLVALGIHPGSLFPGMPDRKIQPIIYEKAREDLFRPAGAKLQ